MNQVTSKTIEQVQDNKVATPLWWELWPWSWELWAQPKPRLGTQVFTDSYILSIWSSPILTFCLSAGSTLSSPSLHLTLTEGKSKYSWVFQTPFLISKVLIFWERRGLGGGDAPSWTKASKDAKHTLHPAFLCTTISWKGKGSNTDSNPEINGMPLSLTSVQPPLTFPRITHVLTPISLSTYIKNRGQLLNLIFW